MNKEDMQKAYEEAQKSKDGCRKLTEREVEIIKLSATGLSQKEIGEELNISPRTISTHNYKAFKKIKAKNIIEAINHVNKFYGG